VTLLFSGSTLTGFDVDPHMISSGGSRGARVGAFLNDRSD
jgi:hypothetical protein